MTSKKLLAYLGIVIILLIFALIIKNLIIYPVSASPSSSQIHINQPKIMLSFNKSLDKYKTTVTSTPKDSISYKITGNAIQIKIKADLTNIESLKISVSTGNRFGVFNYDYNFRVTDETSPESQNEDIANETDSYSIYYPLSGEVPYSEIAGPFKISYGTRKFGQLQTPLEISYSSPDGRKKAFNWLSNKDIRLEQTDIIYPEFHNPLTGKGGVYAY